MTKKSVKRGLKSYEEDHKIGFTLLQTKVIFNLNRVLLRGRSQQLDNQEGDEKTVYHPFKVRFPDSIRYDYSNGLTSS